MVTGILGSSFNPPHRGHLKLAQTVLDKGLADRVCLVPTAIPPHKTAALVGAPERLEMARLLAAGDPRMSVDPIELEREGKSFTIDTIRQLLARHPGHAYRLVIGSDQARAFASWREYRELLRLAPPLVAERPDAPFTGVDDYVGLTGDEAAVLRAGRFDMPPVDVSSTAVRRLVAEGADDRTLLRYLTPEILAFVRTRGLYAARDQGH